MNASIPSSLLVTMPVILGLVCLFLQSPRMIVLFCAAGTTLVAILCCCAAFLVFQSGSAFEANRWLMLDALSAYHIVVMAIIFSLSAIYSVCYFRPEIESGEFRRKKARRYGALWFWSMAAMILVLVSNNLGIIWVGVEASTLLTAFLICVHISSASLEAMWKYLLMCSVGVALAFTGILFFAASTTRAGLHGTDALLWSSLMDVASNLDPALLKVGFIFIVIGYGTKAGLAPMHNWLPDAHSQAPAPVSALFSGFLLNAALYCILRCLPVVEAATGNVGWAREILVLLGIVSIMVAAVFIIAQHDIKRLLAYSSVEHLGIITLGVGLGGVGIFAALLHILNHSLSKTLSFFCAGSLGQRFGTHDMRKMADILRVSPAWGLGLLGGLISLIGMFPFALFLSEFLILKAALDTRSYWTASLFLGGLCVVFVGVLRYAVRMAWEPSQEQPERKISRALDFLLVLTPLAVLLTLGVWLPQPLATILTKAAKVLEGIR